MKKTYLPLLILLIQFISLAAHAGGELTDNELLFFKNHYSVGFNLMMPMINESKSTGGHHLNVYGMPGANVNARYVLNFHKNVGLQVGLDAGVQCISYSFNSQPIQVSNSWLQPYIAVPVLLSPHFVIHGRHVLGLNAGVSMHYMVAVDYNAEFNAKSTLDQMDMNVTLAKKNPYFQPEVGLSYGVVMKNMNIIQLDLHCSIGTKTMVAGNYTWHELDVIKERGEIKSPDTYISIGIHYIFTKALHLKTNMASNRLEPLED